jgi:hypothetical protein
MKLVLTFHFFFAFSFNLIQFSQKENPSRNVMKQLQIRVWGLIECLILLMMKSIRVLEGRINVDLVAK